MSNAIKGFALIEKRSSVHNMLIAYVIGWIFTKVQS